MLDKLEDMLLSRWEQFNIGSPRPNRLWLSLFSKDQEYGKIFIYVFKNNEAIPSLIVKTRTVESDANCFENQYKNLQSIYTNPALKEFAPYVPRPILCERIFDQYIYSETFFYGHQFKNIKFLASRVKYLKKSTEWLIKFHKSTRSYTEYSDTELKNKIFLPITHFEKIKNCGLDIDKIEGYVMQSLKNRQSQVFPMVFYHGDFSPYNILLLNGDIGIVDWEYSQIKGAPLLDLYNFMAYCGYRKFKGSFYKSFLWAFSKKGYFSKLCKSLLDRYNDLLAIDATLTELFLLRFLLELIFLKDKEREDIIFLINLILKKDIRLNIHNASI